MEIKIVGDVKIELNSDLKNLLVYHQDGIPVFPAYLCGEWYYGEKDFIEVKSPINLAVIARIPKVRYEQVSKVLDIMYREGRWILRNIPGEKRLEILQRFADLLEKYKEDIANILVLNAGKTKNQALGEVNASIERLKRASLDVRKIYGEYIPGDWSKDYLEAEGIVKREPIGIVLSIAPFNYVLFDTVDKLIASILMGNPILIKPASNNPLAVLLMAKLLEMAGLPRETFAVITVPGSEMNKVVADRRISAIALTGSAETGLEIMRNGGIKYYLMELGGGDPAIVLSDADINLAAQKIATGITAYSGQRCDSIKLILVEEPVYEEFKKKLVGELSKVKIGDPRDPEVNFGPVIDPKTVDEFEYGVKDALEKGGVIVYGGKRLGPTYIEPTVIEIDKNRVKETYLYNKEVFLSVALLVKVSNVNEAIELANGRRYGLDLAVFGRDIVKIRKIIRFAEVGAIYVNDFPRHGIGYFPYGGRKDSGIGRTGIGYAIEYLSTYKTIVYNYKGQHIWDYM